MDNFNTLGQLTLRCGGNFAGHVYLKYFANKTELSSEEYRDFKRDVQQEFQIAKHSRTPLSPQIESARNQLRNLL